MKKIEVVAAIIKKDNKYLATQRGYGNYKDFWEFPGGKIEPSESIEDALIREIHEELDAEIQIDHFLHTTEYQYPEFYLTMHCFLCSFASDKYTLLEHQSAQWLGLDEIDSVKWLEADYEVLEKLKEFESKQND